MKIIEFAAKLTFDPSRFADGVLEKALARLRWTAQGNLCLGWTEADAAEQRAVTSAAYQITAVGDRIGERNWIDVHVKTLGNGHGWALASYVMEGGTVPVLTLVGKCPVEDGLITGFTEARSMALPPSCVKICPTCDAAGGCPDCMPQTLRKLDEVPEGCEECPGCPDCLTDDPDLPLRREKTFMEALQERGDPLFPGFNHVPTGEPVETIDVSYSRIEDFADPAHDAAYKLIQAWRHSTDGTMVPFAFEFLHERVAELLRGNSPPLTKASDLVYISASWRHRDRVRALAEQLREHDVPVYDFTDPSCRDTPEIPPERFPDLFDSSRHDYAEYLDVPEWRQAVECNREALQECGTVVLLLPSGLDSHADAYYALGLGKRLIIVGNPGDGERVPTHLWAECIVPDDAAALQLLTKDQA